MEFFDVGYIEGLGIIILDFRGYFYLRVVVGSFVGRVVCFCLVFFYLVRVLVRGVLGWV